jgi:hypothetical protein
MAMGVSEYHRHGIVGDQFRQQHRQEVQDQKHHER